MNGTPISFVTAFRKVIPTEVFGANDEANLAADSCFFLHERHQPPLVAGERCSTIVGAGVKLAGEDVRFSDRKASPFAGHQRDARCCVADQCDPSPRPAVHPNLADRVEVDILSGFELFFDPEPLQPASAKAFLRMDFGSSPRMYSSRNTKRNSVLSSRIENREICLPGRPWLK
jgi:hypothetical protein